MGICDGAPSTAVKLEYCLWLCSLANQYWPVGFMFFVVFMSRSTQRLTGSGSGFKAYQKTWPMA